MLPEAGTKKSQIANGDASKRRKKTIASNKIGWELYKKLQV